MIKGTRILVGDEAKSYTQAIGAIRACLHRR